MWRAYTPIGYKGELRLFDSLPKRPPTRATQNSGLIVTKIPDQHKWGNILQTTWDVLFLTGVLGRVQDQKKDIAGKNGERQQKVPGLVNNPVPMLGSQFWQR